MKISVIIPVYNVESYLAECIESVLCQTYKDYEIILVDDGSTDSSGEICDRYASQDSRIRVIHKENGGASAARNVGIGEARGEYIYYLDSDDILADNAFECLINSAEESDPDIVFFEADSFSETGEFKGGNYHYKYKYETDSGKAVLEKQINNKDFHVSTPLLFTKTCFLKESGVKFKKGIMYEDMIYTFELFYKAGRVSHNDKSLYKRRYREFSVMTTNKSKYNYTSAAEVCFELIKFSKLQLITEEEFFKKYISRCAMNCINIFSALSGEDKNACEDVKKRIIQIIREEKYFGSRALKYRCIGYVPWLIYRCFEKIFKA